MNSDNKREKKGRKIERKCIGDEFRLKYKPCYTYSFSFLKGKGKKKKERKEIMKQKKFIFRTCRSKFILIHI